MTPRQKIFLASLTFGLVATVLCIPSILHYFEFLYYAGPHQATSPCGGGLALILTVPLTIVSYISQVLMWAANVVAIALTFLATQLPAVAFLKLTQ